MPLYDLQFTQSELDDILARSRESDMSTTEFIRWATVLRLAELSEDQTGIIEEPWG